MTDPTQEVIDRLQAVRKTGEGQWLARCPAHEDKHPSLSIATGDDGRVLLHCQAGCSTIEVCRALGLPIRALFPPGSSKEKNIAATYDYLDVNGKLLFQVVRFEPKGFSQRRPDGNGGWTWNINGTPRVLYRLPELSNSDPNQWIFIVEGEKDADALGRLGLLATTNPGGAGKWHKLAEVSCLHGRKVAILPDKDPTGLQHSHDVATALMGQTAKLKIIELPGDGKDSSDWIESLDSRSDRDISDALIALAENTPDWTPELGSAPLVPIQIDTDEHRVVAETVDALKNDPDIFQRGGILVRILRDNPPVDSVVRPAGSATIQPLPPATLRERMTRVATFIRQSAKGKDVPAHPTGWLVSAVDARADWPGIRHLFGISETPILRPDGSVWQKQGYDPKTGVLFASNQEFPPIAKTIGLDDAITAWNELAEVICDFRFEAPEHRSAWLAGLLSPLARFAFSGPCPLFLIDANIRGAGKGLLAQTIGRIILGREMPASSYAHDSDEMRKRITSIAIAGDRIVLLDNLEGRFGNDALDRALTITRWKDRILGASREVDMPLMAIWYATGNNVAVETDIARRIIHIRLDVLEEKPEERSGFRHPNLLTWMQQYRPRLVCSALKILSAYCRAGQPDQNLPPFGSFEGWSNLVRQAIVWLGLPDPCVTRARLAESADTTSNSIEQLIEAWRIYSPDDQGMVVAQLLQTLYPKERHLIPDQEATNEMRLAIENLVSCPSGKTPTARQVGNKLRHFRRRVINDTYFDIVQNTYNRAGAVWRLFHV